MCRKGLVVKEARGAVQAAGMKPGDRIAAINGTAVWTFADLQYHYDKVIAAPNGFGSRSIGGGESVELDGRSAPALVVDRSDIPSINRRAAAVL